MKFIHYETLHACLLFLFVKMSTFQLSTCPFDTDTIVNTVAWSHGDNICAMATSTMNDDDDQESHHIHFMNNEV